MRLFTTRIRAIDPVDGKLKSWRGPHVSGINWDDAEEYCRQHLGYCEVDGELVAEIPTKDDWLTADWHEEINYQNNN